MLIQHLQQYTVNPVRYLMTEIKADECWEAARPWTRHFNATIHCLSHVFDDRHWLKGAEAATASVDAAAP